MKCSPVIAGLFVLLALASFSIAQDEVLPPGEAVPGEALQASGTPLNEAAPTVEGSTEEIQQKTTEAVEEIARTVDKNETAKEAATGVLKPIYLLAERLSFPTFHWCAFGLMVAGVVSYAFQLVFGKLVVLSKMGLSISEIISDAVGLVISLIGLVLTTQAATENSTFTQSPAAVLSATVAGAVLGLIMYRWGQATELQAVRGRVVENKAASSKKK